MCIYVFSDPIKRDPIEQMTGRPLVWEALMFYIVKSIFYQLVAGTQPWPMADMVKQSYYSFPMILLVVRIFKGTVPAAMAKLDSETTLLPSQLQRKKKS